MKKTLLPYVDPETKEEIATNLVYLLRENEMMENFTALNLGTTVDISNLDSVRWTFLEKAIPKINSYFNELWKESQLVENDKDIKILEAKLKEML